jgi:hypothetical protein
MVDVIDGASRIDTHDDYQFDVEAEKLGCEHRKAVALPVAVAVFQRDVFSLYPSEFV